MVQAQAMPVPSPRQIEVEGRRFTVAAPRWSTWQGALERAGSADGEVDAQRLLEECLLTCVQGEEGRRISRKELQALSNQSGDTLFAAALQLIEQQRAALALQFEEHTERGRLIGEGVDLYLRAWRFGERNDALRRALRLEDGQVALDLGLYELTMIVACVTEANGQRLSPAAVSAWPVPLGEAVIHLLEQINGLEERYTETLEACIKSGQDHPDITLFHLCRTFGWTPDQAQQIDAQTAERLLIVMKTVQGPIAAPSPVQTPVQTPIHTPLRSPLHNPLQPPAASAVPAAQEGEVTRIIVTD